MIMEGATMDGMGKHELDDSAAFATLPAPAGAPAKHRDHLWVLAIIAVCVLIEVWASWIEIGSMSGFPRIGGPHGISTDWTLAVTTEAYWAYALYSWLAASPGPRSRSFAKWSAGAVFCLSLVGQGAAHLVPPGSRPSPVLVVFVSSLPVLVLALIAILIHLRQADREAAEALARQSAEVERLAAIERAEADERAWLRRELDALGAQRDADATAHRAELDEAVSDLASARQELAQALRRAEALERKLAADDPSKRRRKPAPTTGKKPAATAEGDDLTMELLAYMALQDHPELCKPRMGGKLAVEVGCSPASARRYRDKFLNEDGSLKDLPRESLTVPIE
jgi:hypothetical protein